jgi:(R)-2-hydroxyacyl-CoA dehydratese activating ATPase
MIVAGCDVGSLTAKAVIMADDDILSQAVIRVRAQPADAARQVMQQALDGTDFTWEDMTYCVGTGYGKDRVPFADRVESEISCHARGAWWQVPSARTIIDIGGQDAKAMRVDAGGRVVRYIYNDKCASGTGRFLEVMADALEVRLEDMGRVGQTARETLVISNQCVIFAETEVVSLVNAGKDVPDIVAALHRAMANRVASLAGSIGVESDVVMTGGVAKNAGVFDALAAGIDTALKPLDGLDPQIVGALGAALFAGQHARTSP